MKSRHVHLTAVLALALCGLGTGESTPVPASEAAAPDHLAALAGLIGDWKISGTWADGSKLDARATYRWGIRRKLIHVKTYPRGKDGEYLRYETFIYFDPVKRKLRSFGVAYDGNVGHTTIKVEKGRMDFVPDAAYDPMKLDQWMEFKGQDAVEWVVRTRGDSAKEMIRATWHRQKTPASEK